MNANEKREIYAELIVRHGLNIQQGQILNISTEAIHRDFAMLVAEAAYAQGARYVHLDLSEPRLECVRVESSREEDLRYVPPFLGVKFKDLVDESAANLKLIGSEYPDGLANLDPKRVNTIRLHQRLAVKYFYDEGIGKSRVHWTVAAAATPRWGRKVFPAVEDPETACRRLWDEILAICRADQPDCLCRWQAHNQILRERARRLTEMKIRELHFTGPETDLRVALSPQAIFKGGTDRGPRGVDFEPNLPTEEVFTTPDWRGTRGKARATRPFLINGKLIEGLHVVFKEGRIASFAAAAGADTFREYIHSDDGACRLGEIALVGTDSPVYQSGLVFQEILFDENAACHMAVGSAYKFCLDGGDSMSKQQLDAIGCNDSSVHTDMMISSDQVDVAAVTYAGQRVPLIRSGAWVARA